MEKTIQELAAEVSKMFVMGKRDNGAEYWHRKDNTPDWVQDMCHEAHGNMFPDDHKYLFIVDALDIISESEDYTLESPEIQADVYHSDLLTWLSSHNERTCYVDDARENFGMSPDGIMAEIAWGQQAEKEEVYQTVLAFLVNKLEEMNTEEGEDNE